MMERKQTIDGFAAPACLRSQKDDVRDELRSASRFRAWLIYL
jgi:hypothetical protein